MQNLDLTFPRTLTIEEVTEISDILDDICGSTATPILEGEEVSYEIEVNVEEHSDGSATYQFTVPELSMIDGDEVAAAIYEFLQDDFLMESTKTKRV